MVSHLSNLDINDEIDDHVPEYLRTPNQIG
jgi:hypothetical protein